MVVWEKHMNYSLLEFEPEPRDTSTRGASFTSAIGSFDIETSRIKDIEQSIMYVWQFCVDFPDGHDVVILGRTWIEFQHCLFALKQRLKGLHMLCYIHNASYEFAFLAGIYKFKDNEVFILEGRSILYFRMYQVYEFRCSYKLTNMSLSEATAKYAPDYHKKDGSTYGYEELRFADTPLTRKQLLYCVYDVWGCCKLVRALMRLFGDTIYTIPYTSTGYVRREAKAAMREHYAVLKHNWPDYDCFKLLRAAFRGGNTHASRFYSGQILHNVDSMDISSSYPTQECLRKYPMTKFISRDRKSEAGLDYYITHGAACLIHAELRLVELRDRYEPIPYLPLAKCIKYPENVRLDNGRIVSCSKCEIVITDIDYEIINRQYCFSMTILDLYTSWYDFLPLELQNLNCKYFTQKTKLKGVKGQELYYLKAKNLLNSIYGDFVMNPLRVRILYKDGLFEPDDSKTDVEILEKAGKNPYKLYQWGVWCTAWARYQLQQGIDLVGPDHVVYCDTDSVKFVGKADFTSFNGNMQMLSLHRGCYADDAKGKRHYMGLFEHDEHYTDFITWGAKKYAYSTDTDGPHITVAGVPKKSGAVELLYNGGLPAFKPGFIWKDTGKLEAVYNDTNIGFKMIEGRRVNITKNIVLRPTTYQMSLTDDYQTILEDSSDMLKIAHKNYINLQL